MGSKGSSSTPPPAPSQQDIADANAQAQIKYLPQAAQVQYDILNNPTYGLQATTQLAENARRNVFTGESGIRDQLLQNVLASLQSPTGISAEQQTAIDARRGKAQGELTTALRNRANLGGGLYGGRSAQEEQNAVIDLQNQFVEEDIGREERARLNAINSALPILQILFPDLQLQSPQFINPVPGADTAYSGAVTARGQDISYLNQQSQNDAALKSALFQALGSAAGSAAGAAVLCWVASEIFGGWLHPKTCQSRLFINEIAPIWFKNFYIKHGKKIAVFIRNKRLIKLLLKPVFEIFSLIGKIAQSRCNYAAIN